MKEQIFKNDFKRASLSPNSSSKIVNIRFDRLLFNSIKKNPTKEHNSAIKKYVLINSVKTQTEKTETSTIRTKSQPNHSKIKKFLEQINNFKDLYDKDRENYKTEIPSLREIKKSTFPNINNSIAYSGRHFNNIKISSNPVQQQINQLIRIKTKNLENCSTLNNQKSPKINLFLKSKNVFCKNKLLEKTKIEEILKTSQNPSTLNLPEKSNNQLINQTSRSPKIILKILNKEVSKIVSGKKLFSVKQNLKNKKEKSSILDETKSYFQNINITLFQDAINDALFTKQFFYHVKSNQKKEVVNILQVSPKTVNKKDFVGSTAIHYAVKRSFVTMTKILLTFEADVNEVDAQNNPPIYYAFTMQNERILKVRLTAFTSQSCKPGFTRNQP